MFGVSLVDGATAIIAAAGGIYIAVHELRRRERKVTRKEISELTDEVDALRHLLLEQRSYIYHVVTLLIDNGLEAPPPPAPSFDPGEYTHPDAQEPPTQQ